NAYCECLLPDFEKYFEKHDGDMRDGATFATPADKSNRLSPALRYDIHPSRTYRRSLDEFRRLRGKGPTRNPKSSRVRCFAILPFCLEVATCEGTVPESADRHEMAGGSSCFRRHSGSRGWRKTVGRGAEAGLHGGLQAAGGA